MAFMKSNRKVLEIEDAELMWPDFVGGVSERNRSGDKKFDVVIEDPEEADRLFEDGWNVKCYQPEGREPKYHIPVVIKFHPVGSGLEHLNPKIIVHTDYSDRELTDENMGAVLNMIDIQAVDVVLVTGKKFLRPDGREGYKAWLQEMHVIARESRIARKWSRDE